MAYEVSGKQMGFRGVASRVSYNVGAFASRVLKQPPDLKDMQEAHALGFRDVHTIYLSAPEHAGRITYETIETTKSKAHHDSIAEMVRELAEDHDWVMLGELLEEWDQARAACEINRRVMHTALQVVTKAVQTEPMVDDGAPMTQARLPDAVVAEVEAEADANPHLYALTALAAQMRLAQAWDYRGQSSSAPVPVQCQQKLEKAIAKAQELIGRLDAKALNAPMVSMIDFNLLPFLKTGGQRMMDVYKDWICLDPADLMPHVKIGKFLLPNWFGSYDMLERTALQAVSWTEHEIGTSAYAAIYGSALQYDKQPFCFMDVELFAEATEDLITIRRRDPTHVPLIVQDLWKFARLTPPDGIDSDGWANWMERTARMNTLAVTCISRHLTGIHEESWPGGAAKALDYISVAAQDALRAGDNLVMNRRGITRTSM